MNNESKTAVFEIKTSPSLVSKFQEDLQDKGFAITQIPYAHFSAKSDGVSCTLYTSGKIVVQGKKMHEFIEFYLEPEILHSVAFTYKETAAKTTILAPQATHARIGSDETGKGDFFGPLVIACAYVDPITVPQVLKIGVKDSKKLTDPVILKYAAELKKLVPHEIIKISPKRYNEMYASFNNLNSLLAWGHATAIKALVARTQCNNVIVDKFAEDFVLERALDIKKTNIQLIQRTKGEEDIAVASASILARAAFVEAMNTLEKEWGVRIPKGASSAVIDAGKEFVKKHGADNLPEIAKMHFKTTQEVL